MHSPRTNLRYLLLALALALGACNVVEDPLPPDPTPLPPPPVSADYRDAFIRGYHIVSTSCSGIYNGGWISDTSFYRMVITPYGTNRVEFRLGYNTVRPVIDSFGNIGNDPDQPSEFRISGRIFSSDSLSIAAIYGPGCAMRGSQWEARTY